MKTCILVANEDEAKHILPILTENKNAQIIVIGEGRSNVLRNISEKLKDGTICPEDNIINIGYVGANGYKKSDVVHVKNVKHLFPSKTIYEPVLTLKTINTSYPIVHCYTADNFVNKEDIDIKDSCIIDMELYYIALMFPNVISFKIVSDELNYEDYKEANFEDAWEKARKIIKDIL